MFASGASAGEVLKGAWAGTAATLPMTVLMQIGWALLPPDERYPLPPREITETLALRAGAAPRLSEDQLTAATLASHFGFGAMAGAWYARLEHRFPLPALLKGMIAGLAVWTGSYMGWIPALGILKPATRHPMFRNALMIIVHLVWGGAMALIYRRLAGAAGD